MERATVKLATAEYRSIVRNFVRNLINSGMDVPAELSSPFYTKNMPENFVNDALTFYYRLKELES